MQRDLRHVGIGHRLDHLGAVLDDAGLLVRAAHHVARDVLQVDDGRARLAAGLDEVRGLGGAVGIDRAVVGDDAHRVAFQADVAADGGAAVVLAEGQELRAVGDARDDLAHVHRPAAVGGHEAHQLLGVVARRREGARRLVARPVDAAEDGARDAQRVAVVLGQVVAQARDVGVHDGAAQFFLGGDLAGGGLQQRRPGQEGPRAVAHHHDVVRQARLVGATRGRRAVRHGHHRQARGREPREVAEDVAAAHEVLHAVLHEVGARAFHQLDEGQLVLQRDLVQPQLLVQPHGLQRAGVDAGVGGADHAAHARHAPDAGDQAAAGHAFRKVGVVLAQARQRGQRQEGRAGVQQQREAFARQQLAALGEALGRGAGGGHGAGFMGPDLLQQREHAGAVGLVGVSGGMQPGFEEGHGGLCGARVSFRTDFRRRAPGPLAPTSWGARAVVQRGRRRGCCP
ncbi:hypothetical protein FQZ97_760200 [compost metagenome]